MTARGVTCQDRHLRLSFGVTSQHRACQTHQTHNLQQRGRFLCKCSPSRAINDVKLLVASTRQTSIHNVTHVETERALGLTPEPDCSQQLDHQINGWAQKLKKRLVSLHIITQIKENKQHKM